MRPEIAIVQAEETEEQLIERAQQAISSSNWTVGECAAKWVQKYAQGRTDSDFAEMIGSTQQRVNEARRVYERFGSHWNGVYRIPVNITWSHFVTVLPLEDATEVLDLAIENNWTVSDLKVWLRTTRGEAENRSAPSPSIWNEDAELDEQRTDSATPDGEADCDEEEDAFPDDEENEPSDWLPSVKRETRPEKKPEDDTELLFRKAMDAIDLIVDRIDDEDRKTVAQRLREAADRLDPQ